MDFGSLLLGGTSRYTTDLLDIVGVLEKLVAIGAIVVVLDLVLDKALLAAILVVADTALMANMTFGVHMLPASSIAVESCEASITTVSCILVRSLMVVVVIQMLFKILLIVKRLVARIAEVNHGDSSWRKITRRWQDDVDSS